MGCAALVTVMLGAGCVTNADPDEPMATGADSEAVTQPDGASARRPAHCVAPWGIDWNAVLDVDRDAIVNAFCTEVHAGDRYTPEVLWITNTEDGIEGGPVLYPPDYRPVFKAPMTDFLHKLIGVRYFIHPGNQEFSFLAAPIEKVVTVGALYHGSPDFTPPQLVWPATALLGALPALPPGSYSADIHFVMLARHCDGQTTDPAASCLPPGDSLVITRDFVVTP